MGTTYQASKGMHRDNQTHRMREQTKVAHGGGLSLGAGVHVLVSSHVQELLGDWGRHDASTTGSRDETHGNRSALSGHLAGHGVGLTDLDDTVNK